MPIWVFTGVFHHCEDLWSDEHVLDAILVNGVLVVANAIVVLNSLLVQEHEVADRIHRKGTSVDLQFMV